MRFEDTKVGQIKEQSKTRQTKVTMPHLPHKLDAVINEYRACDYDCIACTANEKIPYFSVTWCEFLRQYGKTAINEITKCMEGVL